MLRGNRVPNSNHFYQLLKFVSFCVESCTKTLNFVQAFYATYPGIFHAIVVIFALTHGL